MAVTVKNFIAELAQATNDPTMVVNEATDWIEIINSNGSELSPEILFENTSTIQFSTLDSTTQDVDMSSATDYEGLYKIKTVYLEDSNGKRFIYNNWSFDKSENILSLLPRDDASYIDTIVGDVRPSGSYPTIIINWMGDIPDTRGDGSINLSKPRLTLFRKVCVREGLRRILMDHMKLDRYRTLVGRANEYSLLAIIRDMTSEIELDKSKLTNSNSVKVF